MKEKEFAVFVSYQSDNDGLTRKWVSEHMPEADSEVFRLAYQAPFEAFKGIKKFQETVLRYRPFQDMGRDKVVILDLQEWITHEEEEYLTAFLAFLHDYSGLFSLRFVITVGDKTEQDAAKLFEKCDLLFAGGRWVIQEDVLQNMLSEFRLEQHLRSGLKDLLKAYKLSVPQARLVVQDLLGKLDTKNAAISAADLTANRERLMDTKLMRLDREKTLTWLSALEEEKEC